MSAFNNQALWDSNRWLTATKDEARAKMAELNARIEELKAALIDSREAIAGHKGIIDGFNRDLSRNGGDTEAAQRGETVWREHFRLLNRVFEETVDRKTEELNRKDDELERKDADLARMRQELESLREQLRRATTGSSRGYSVASDPHVPGGWPANEITHSGNQFGSRAGPAGRRRSRRDSWPEVIAATREHFSHEPPVSKKWLLSLFG